MPKIKLYVCTGFAGCKHVDYRYIPDDEWDEMTKTEQEDLLDQLAQDHMVNCIDYGAFVVEEEDE